MTYDTIPSELAQRIAAQPTHERIVTKLNGVDVAHITDPVEIQRILEGEFTQADQSPAQPPVDKPSNDKPEHPLFAALRSLIRQEIETVLNDTAVTKSLLGAISEEHEEKIREIALEIMQEHNDEYDHDSYDAMDRRIDDIDSRLDEKADTDDVPHKREIEEMVSDAVNEALESAVESEVSDAIDNYDMSDKISDYLHDNEYINRHDVTRLVKDAKVVVHNFEVEIIPQ